jgi:adenine-specific DNA glycosylase
MPRKQADIDKQLRSLQRKLESAAKRIGDAQFKRVFTDAADTLTELSGVGIEVKGALLKAGLVLLRASALNHGQATVR